MNTGLETARDHRNTEESNAALHRLKYRILSVIPPGTVYLEMLLKLSDIHWSDAISTAAVTGGGSPQLLFNREFVQRYCSLEEDFMMLVLHELHHLLYGHHNLFKGAGEAHNIAFDAIINARLCRSWKTLRHAHLFQQVYQEPGFPEILLCPPPGWPNGPAVADIRKEKERLEKTLDPRLVWNIQYLRGKLYLGNGNDVTYEDILRLLQEHAPESKPLLLGNHEPSQDTEEREGALNEQDPASDPFLVETVRQMDRQIEKCAGGDMGLQKVQPTGRNPRREFLNALRAVLVKAGVYQQRASRHRHRAMADTLRQSVSILPEWRDRTIVAKEQLLDTMPLLYARELPVRAPLWMPARQAHIYLDVSGSMIDDLPWIIKALEPLERGGLCRIYLFSTEVFDIPAGHIGSKPLKTTWGTEIECVLQHLIDQPEKKRPRQAVILTDGGFEKPGARLLKAFQKTAVALHGAITYTGCIHPMHSIADTTVKMPDYH